MSPEPAKPRPRRWPTKAHAAAQEAALQMIYALEMGDQDPAQVETWYVQAHPLPPQVREQAGALLDSAARQRERIEDLIRRHATRWRLERISPIDRSLIKLGVAGMLLPGTMAPAEVVQHALELCKRYSQPGAEKFVHAVLDAISRELKAGSTA